MSEVGEGVSSTHWGTAPLLMACRNGHTQVVWYLIDKCNVDIEQVGNITIDHDQFRGVSALWCAAAAGQFDVVKLLISYKANVNCLSANLSTPLRAACFDGHLDIVKLLIDRGADIELANDHNHTCLMIASFRGHLDVVQYLLDCGADVNRKSDKGNTALHDAAVSNNVEIMKILLHYGAVMEPDHRNLTPILAAALEAHVDVVEYLIDSGELCPLEAKISAVELLGATCLDKENNMKKALHYWELGFHLRSTCPEAFLPKAVSDSLLNKHTQAKEAKTLTELHELANDSDAIMFHSLLLRERILGPTHPDNIYYISLRGAVYADAGDDYHCLKLWLYAIDIQQNAIEPCSILTISIFNLFLDLFCSKLKETKLNNIKNPIFEFELWIKFFSRVISEIKRGMESNRREDEPESNTLHRMIHTALNGISQFTTQMEYYSVQQIKTFKNALREFVKLNPLAFDKKSLLHIACRRSMFDIHQPTTLYPNPSLVKLLVEVGACPIVQDKDFNTPLHEAARNATENDSILFKTLLELGGHYDAKNKSGLMAVQLIKSAKRLDISSLEHTSLQCLCARIIKINYMNCDALPKLLQKFVNLH